MAHFISLCLGFNSILWGKGARIMRETQRMAEGCTCKVHLDSHAGSSQCAEIWDECLCLCPWPVDGAVGGAHTWEPC